MIAAGPLSLLISLLIAFAQESVPAETVVTNLPFQFKDALVLSCGSSPRRNAFAVDPVSANFIYGTWRAPAAGDKVSMNQLNTNEKEQLWTKATAGDDGWLHHNALRNGYAYFSVDSAAERVSVLDASAHSLVYVNGDLRTGDWYETGYMRIPVKLQKGKNEFVFMARRGKLRAQLLPAAGTYQFDSADVTLPDAVAGEAVDAWGAIPVLNNNARPSGSLQIEVECGGKKSMTSVDPILSFSTRKSQFKIIAPAQMQPGELSIKLTLMERGADGTDRPIKTGAVELKLRVRDPGATRKITFVSAIDGSVQYYCINPAKLSSKDAEPGLVLSLHGAAVEATSQCDSYARKEDIYIVCPTNRRPYGFDWEDWGRLDAIEVLTLAKRSLKTDLSKTWLTGHSMGGHGTWQLGALFPDQFAAIAPSAGWISFFSYAGSSFTEGEKGVGGMLKRALSSSDTLSLVNNYKQHGVYILHGDADDNVPVSEARKMRETLQPFHTDLEYHEQKGAGHWWGGACVDWPPIFDMFSKRTIPNSSEVKKIEFTTPSPSVSSRCHWIEILQQTRAFTPSTVNLSINSESRKFSGTTKNVAKLAIHPTHAGMFAPEGFSVEIDGQKLQFPDFPESGGPLLLANGDDGWKVIKTQGSGEKNPARGGVFKDAFRNNVLFVYGTRGSVDENNWMLRKARYDAEVLWMRGNGSIDVVSDSEFNSKAFADRNVILYGNSETNAAWGAALGACPININKKGVFAGAQKFEGPEYGCLFVYPRAGSNVASVGVVGGSGIVGSRMLDRINYFVSGVGFPDVTVIGSKDTTDKSGANIKICGAGFFSNEWQIERGEFAWGN
ncbi:MAG: prolyl oligopeptidase family serine peptidase [Planctomycetota bacterium]